MGDHNTSNHLWVYASSDNHPWITIHVFKFIVERHSLSIE